MADMARVSTLETAYSWVLGAESFMPNDHFLVTIAALVLLVIGSGSVWHVRNYRRSSAIEFKTLLAEKDAIAVLMHSNPDPDAMACAWGVKRIAEHVGTEATLQYPGEISHQENRAFQTVLDLELEQVENTNDLAAADVVLVDHNVPRGFDGASSLDPFAVIDHHPGNGSGDEFTDVRTDYGACASILAEYFEDLDASRSGNASETSGNSDRIALPSRLATGLVYGIQSDTKRLSKGCSMADFDAYRYLYPAIDEEYLDRIANPLVDAEVIDVIRRAIADRDCRSPFAISDVGSVTNLDAIPQAADELVCVEDSTAVVVLGEKGSTLYFSGRSRDDRVHIGQALGDAVEEIPMADAGGHARMGGGQVSIPHMNGIGPSHGLSRDEFHDRLFDAMAGET